MGFFQTSGILNRRGFFGGASAPAYDSDAQAYITAVETADNQSLETGVKDAINTFVVGCKADGIWGALKAACILMGARTIGGILVNLPTATTIATNNNFVSGDYNRKNGLIGNGSTKYLATGRAHNADGQNDFHLSCYIHTTNTSTRCYIGRGGGGTGDSNIFDLGSDIRFRNRNGNNYKDVTNGNIAGLVGSTRSGSSSFTYRQNKTNSTYNSTSETPNAENISVYQVNVGNGFYSSARLQFYSIGTNIDLALLDSRLQTLVTDIAAGIP